MDKENSKREMRSFLMPRDPSEDRRFRPRPPKQQRLFDEVIPETSEKTTTTTKDDASSIDNSELEPAGPKVFLRLRPVESQSKLYVISDCGNVLITTAATTENSSNNVCRMEKHYSFTSIFDSLVGQRDVYDKCVGPRIAEEECVTIMAYGTSGSGKTYTLLGDNVRAGVIPLALEHIFTLYSNLIYTQPKLKLINARVLILEDDVTRHEMQMRRQLLALCPDITAQHQRLQQVIRGDHEFVKKPMEECSVMIWVSFVEIYNELVYDLLTVAPRQANMCAPPRKNLKIVCNKGQVFIKGLTSIFVRSSEEALMLLRLGQQRLTYASTAVNANSSRSHCIFTVDVLKYHRNSGETIHNTYKFCDLAGSERVDKTGTIGSRLKEAQSINTSLMVLGRCLDAASSIKKKTSLDVIPYRDSKLTMLLQAALLGKERLAMIVTVTPLDKYYEENLNVLNFASIAKNILFKEPPVKQHNSSYSAFVSSRDKEYIAELEAQNISLRAEIDQLRYEHVLKMQLQEERIRKEITDRFQESIQSAQNISLRAENDQLLKMQLQEERIRKEITDRFQESIQSNLKVSEERHEKKIKMLNREFEAKIASLKRKYEEQIEELKSNSDIEISR